MKGRVNNMVFNYVWLMDSNENILEFERLASKYPVYFQKVKKPKKLERLINKAIDDYNFHQAPEFPMYIEFDSTIDIGIIMICGEYNYSNHRMFIIPQLNCYCVVDISNMGFLSLEDLLILCIRKGRVLMRG